MARGTPVGRHSRFGSATGKNAPFKKTGYGSLGPVPDAAIGVKPGKVDGTPYSGPGPIQIPDRGF